jgi:hypothetical protein
VEEACEVRPPLTAGESSQYISTTGIAIMCANCRKTKRLDGDERWDWVPEMLRRDNFKVSHGLCPRCSGYLYG